MQFIESVSSTMAIKLRCKRQSASGSSCGDQKNGTSPLGLMLDSGTAKTLNMMTPESSADTSSLVGCCRTQVAATPVKVDGITRSPSRSTDLDRSGLILEDSTRTTESTDGLEGKVARSARRTWADDTCIAPLSDPQNERRPPRKHNSIGDIITKSASGPGRLDALPSDSGSSAIKSTSPLKLQSFYSVSTTGSGNGRAQQRGEDLRRVFSLACAESLIDDWSCALMSRRRILLQGRLYVFTNFICFYSNVFGICKKIVLPIREVISIRKRKNAGIFPNSIEIMHSGRAHFFTSFLCRDEAYKAVTFSNYARLFAEPESRDTSPRNSSLLSSTVSDGGPVSEDFGAESEEPAAWDTDGRHSKRRAGIFHRATDCNKVHFKQCEDSPEEDEETDDESGYSSESSDSTHGMAEGVIWELKEGTAPPSAPGYKTMLSETLNCTPREFFAAFLSDRSTFWKDVLVERGDKGVKFDSWSSHSKLGTVRSVYFVSPVKAPIGPPETRCHQSQRYNVYENDHLVLETSQVMNDIPYGDYFSVDMRWDVTAASRTTSLVELRINIPFTRKTMLKGKIEKTTAGETSACFAAWMSKAKEHLEIGASQQSEGSGKCVKRGRRKRSSDSASMASHDARDVRGHEDAAACSTIRYPGDYASEAAVAPETLTTSVTSWVSSAAPSMQVWMGIAIIVLMLLNTYLFLAPRRSCTCQVGPTAMNGMMQENMLMMQQQILDTQQQLAHVMRGLSETAGRMAAASYDVRSP